MLMKSMNAVYFTPEGSYKFREIFLNVREYRAIKNRYMIFLLLPLLTNFSVYNFTFTNTIEWSKEQIDTHNKVIPYFYIRT